MKTKNIALTLFTITALTIAFYPLAKSRLAPVLIPVNIDTVDVKEKPILVNRNERPRIQLAILLDTSSSMDGLIDQTRNQIWQVINEFSTAKQHGVTPILEVALFDYGNTQNKKGSGYVRQLNAFTQELDLISEGLFSLTTSGGDEYCGYAIATAVNTLEWSDSDSDIKTIFIAGNEAFTQGPINFRDALALANAKGIVVNTIFAGSHQSGIQVGWRQGATLAGGDYMSIDANQEVVHITAPEDKQIAQLNRKLNGTYVPYGKDGARNIERQRAQDKLSEGISLGLLSKRVKSKVSSFYNNTKWDLVDAMEEGELNDDELAAMDEDVMPAAMKGMSVKEKKKYVQSRTEERKSIKQEIEKLSESRQAYVSIQRSKIAPMAEASVSDAFTSSMKKEAKDKGFVFDKKTNNNGEKNNTPSVGL